MIREWRCGGLVLAAVGSLGLLSASFGQSPGVAQLDLECELELGVDRGQNLGTLFELLDAKGRVLAGGGFQAAYNTQPRYERQLLQVFVRNPDGAVGWEVERLPAIDSAATGFYPFSYDGQLLVHNRSEKGRRPTDPRVLGWDVPSQQWQGRDEAAPYSQRVEGKLLEVTPGEVRWDGQVVLRPDGNKRFAEHYLAGGKLLIKEVDRQADPPINQLAVFVWDSPATLPLERLSEATLELPIPYEFMYAFGQWQDQILAVSNNGRVSRLVGDQWETLREPEPGVSYQVYAALTHYDQLLLGHYPTGELYAYDGQQLSRLEGWPPRMPGVSPAAREAQTLALYGGDLYVGVWPWGEVWRRDADRDSWCLADRMFKHPQPSPATVHPYENETRRVDPVGNLWGQRITGLYPLDQWLYITTSSKGSGPWEDKFDFLTPELQGDYGAIYRARVPGVMTVPVSWREGSTRLTIRIEKNMLHIAQDDQPLGQIEIPSSLLGSFQPTSLRWGTGMFGPAPMEIKVKKATWSSFSWPAPWRASYLHLERLVPASTPADELEGRIEQIVEAAHRSGINTLLPYTTGSRGQAYYPSQLVAERPYGTSDPVGLVLQAARRRGMAVYPVLCLTVCGYEQPRGILESQPDWGLRNLDGSPLGYISPAQPEARRWLASVAGEVAGRYRPDGLLLDYVRYHNRPLRLDSAAEERFEASLPVDISDELRASRLQRFKEEELTKMVEQISRAIRSASPESRVAAYCWGPYTLANHLTAQVWDRWVDAGLIDLVNISGYFHHAKYGEQYMQRFERQMNEAMQANAKLSRQAQLTFALGVSTSHGDVRSADDIRGYLRAAEQAGLGGVAFFTWDTLQPYLDELDVTGDIPNSFEP
jgi:uncharacterized lipoprotein YddW (UPF0748 family)